MKIGLYGIYGTYNFGCEAIVRGSVQFLKNIYPNCCIVYFSYSYAYDIRHLNDLDIQIFNVKVSRSVVKRGLNKFQRIFNIPNEFMIIDYKRMIADLDMVVSIGGDIYTIPAYLREKKKYPYYNRTVRFCNEVIKRGKNVILYGASVGPFGQYKCAVEYYKENLSKYSQILCRESKSVNYLKSINLRNAYFLPDPAFLVRENCTNLIEKNYIGINFSPLALREVYGEYSANMVNQLANLIKKLYDTMKIDLLFIPHVISPDEADNDFIFLKKIYDNLQDNIKRHVFFADTTNGFLGIKKQVRACRFVIAARMHCAINAIVECVPALFLAYSQKSWGMCQYIYGDMEWTVDLKIIQDELISKAVKMNSQVKKLQEIINEKTKSIEQQYDEYYKHNRKNGDYT